MKERKQKFFFDKLLTIVDIMFIIYTCHQKDGSILINQIM